MNKRRLFLIVAIVLIIAFSFTMVACKGKTGTTADNGGKKVKAGFIYVGPIGDYGFSNAHDLGRQYVAKKFPWLETTYVENVPEADVARYIDRLITEEKCDIVFTCSFGYMDATIAAGAKYPDKIFMHCSGYKRANNVGTYFAELYQMYYLTGLMAGAMTKSEKIGYVAAFPTPEVVRHINAFAIGIKEVNPKAKVYVKWLFSWYDPAKAREAAEALVTEGCDALSFTEDSPSVIEVGQEHTAKGQPVYTFSHYSPMQKFGPDSVVSGELVDWGVMYETILQKVHDKTWKNDDYWWLAAQKAALLGGNFDSQINPKFVDMLKKFTVTSGTGTVSVYDLVMKRLADMMKSPVAFEPFTGPIKDQTGKVRIPAGSTASHDDLWTMDYFIDNVVGTIPKN